MPLAIKHASQAARLPYWSHPLRPESEDPPPDPRETDLAWGPQKVRHLSGGGLAGVRELDLHPASVRRAPNLLPGSVGLLPKMVFPKPFRWHTMSASAVWALVFGGTLLVDQTHHQRAMTCWWWLRLLVGTLLVRQLAFGGTLLVRQLAFGGTLRQHLRPQPTPPVQQSNSFAVLDQQKEAVMSMQQMTQLLQDVISGQQEHKQIISNVDAKFNTLTQQLARLTEDQHSVRQEVLQSNVTTGSKQEALEKQVQHLQQQVSQQQQAFNSATAAFQQEQLAQAWEAETARDEPHRLAMAHIIIAQPQRQQGTQPQQHTATSVAAQFGVAATVVQKHSKVKEAFTVDMGTPAAAGNKMKEVRTAAEAAGTSSAITGGLVCRREKTVLGLRRAACFRRMETAIKNTLSQGGFGLLSVQHGPNSSKLLLFNPAQSRHAALVYPVWRHLPHSPQGFNLQDSSVHSLEHEHIVHNLRELLGDPAAAPTASPMQVDQVSYKRAANSGQAANPNSFQREEGQSPAPKKSAMRLASNATNEPPPPSPPSPPSPSPPLPVSYSFATADSSNTPTSAPHATARRAPHLLAPMLAALLLPPAAHLPLLLALALALLVLGPRLPVT